MISAFQPAAFQSTGFQVGTLQPQPDPFGQGGGYAQLRPARLRVDAPMDDDEVMLMFAQFIINQQARR
jgi:hypothetical protein